jgi:hypothetical protein
MVTAHKINALLKMVLWQLKKGENMFTINLFITLLILVAVFALFREQDNETHIDGE